MNIMAEHSIVGAGKTAETNKEEEEAPPKFYRCCKCFASEFISSDNKPYHKVCCYVYTTDGSRWVGSYDYEDKDISLWDDFGWPSSDDLWCSCCGLIR